MTATRREVLQLAVLGSASAGVASCARLVPDVPPRRRPGPERRVITACGGCPAGCGIAVRVAGEDAVQISGVAGHPISDGGVCPRGIAEIQNLYHPERVRAPGGGWTTALDRLAGAVRGSETLIAIGDVDPVERRVLEWLSARLSARTVGVALPFGSPPAGGLRALLGSDAFGFDLLRSDLVLSLGADWLQAWPSPVEAQRALAAIRSNGGAGPRLLTADARLSITAAKSDQWLPVPPGGEALFGLAIAHAILSRRGDAEPGALGRFALDPRFAPARVAEELGLNGARIEQLAALLVERPKAVVVSAGGDPAREIACVLLDRLIGAVGRPGGLVARRAPAALPPPIPLASATSAPAGAATVLLYRANPLHLAPASSGWQAALAAARHVASFTSFLDESAAAAHQVLPLTTPLESRRLTVAAAMNGVPFVSAGPAAVKPLHDTLEGAEALLRLARAIGLEPPWRDAAACTAELAEALGASDLLAKGGAREVASTAPDPAGAPLEDAAVELLARHVAAAPEARAPEYPLRLSVYVPLAFLGGEGAHLPYLHGLPGGGGRELWQTAAELHPEAARRAGVTDRSPVWVESSEGRIRCIARVRQGIRPDTVAIALGLGRRALGPFAAGHGANPLDLVGKGPLTSVRLRSAT